MTELQGFQKKYLRGLAHKLQPVVMVGQKGLSQALIKSIAEALTAHELVKVKFTDFKERVQKEDIASNLAAETDSRLAGIIGHVAIFYRPHPKPEKRKIVLPTKSQ